MREFADGTSNRQIAAAAAEIKRDLDETWRAMLRDSERQFIHGTTLLSRLRAVHVLYVSFLVRRAVRGVAVPDEPHFDEIATPYSDLLKQLPGYDPDVQKNRAQARQIMQKLGYGPDNRLKIKVSTRDLPPFRDPAVILIDQLKEVYFDGDIETIDNTLYYPKVLRKDYAVGLNNQPSGPDPDPVLDAFYGCGSSLN